MSIAKSIAKAAKKMAKAKVVKTACKSCKPALNCVAKGCKSCCRK